MGMSNKEIQAMFAKINNAKQAGVTKKSLMEFEITQRKIGKGKTDELILDSNMRFRDDVKSMRVNRDSEKTLENLSRLQQQNQMLAKAHSEQQISKDPKLKKLFLNQPRGSEGGFRSDVQEINR